MPEIEKCTLCGYVMPIDHSEEWNDGNGNALVLESSSFVSVIAYTSVGEIRVCENCIKNDLPTFLTDGDKSEIYYEYGLTLIHLGRFEEAIKSLKNSIRNADTLASMGYSYDALGDSEEAIKLYKEAISLNPEHLMANLNLNSNPS